MKSFKILAIMLPAAVFLMSASCNSGKKANDEPLAYSDVKHQYQKPMIEMNKEIIAVNDEMIRGFIKRRNWDMQQSPSGLYYQIYSHSDGEMPLPGANVEFTYNTWLLDGTLIYSSDSLGNREMLIGHNNEESGIDEGLRLMRVGEKARFILHPHLAFGVPGDGYKVPYRAVLVYDIELIAIKN